MSRGSTATIPALWRGGIEISLRITRVNECCEVLKIAVNFPRSNESVVTKEIEEGLVSSQTAFLKASGWELRADKIKFASLEFRLVVSLPGADVR